MDLNVIMYNDIRMILFICTTKCYRRKKQLVSYTINPEMLGAEYCSDTFSHLNGDISEDKEKQNNHNSAPLQRFTSSLWQNMGVKTVSSKDRTCS